jgi:hypothetical protein
MIAIRNGVATIRKVLEKMFKNPHTRFMLVITTIVVFHFMFLCYISE